MSADVTLRRWQRELVDVVAAHEGDDLLVVACPAAGKTIAGAAAAAEAMRRRGCDQLVVVCPTVVVRDQWAAVLGELGLRMVTDFRGAWPDYVHGVCATYAQVAQRQRRYAEALERRGTVVILDEIHHAGERLSWGDALTVAFGGARMRLMLSGTPFRSDRDRIPFVRYDAHGMSVPDFAYDYPQAVRDGVCRPVEFRAHDGLITWRAGDGSQTARFSEPLPRQDWSRRLRASLDPDKSYLRELLQAAHGDLLEQRDRVPDAAGLVVCDSQAHALAVDRLITEVTGSVPALAMSDIPRAHQAIRQFAGDRDEWIVSVRMVAEGVDIPRLGVIAWATAARTELMVRQVSGRALRRRSAHAPMAAVVHMPADPQLIAYAECLDALGGSEPHSRRSGGVAGHSRVAPSSADVNIPARSHRRVDPAPFLAWFDQQAEIHGTRSVLARIGWPYESGVRKLYRWRHAGERPHVLVVYDACHMADVSFAELYEGAEFDDVRSFVTEIEVSAVERLDLRSVDAVFEGGLPRTIAPSLPAAGGVGADGDGAAMALPVPELPPSPEDLRAVERAREAARADLFRLLSVYAELRRTINPAYQIAAAHHELASAAGGFVGADASDEQIGAAVAWVRSVTAELAARYPAQVKRLAAEQRSAAGDPR